MPSKKLLCIGSTGKLYIIISIIFVIFIIIYSIIIQINFVDNEKKTVADNIYKLATLLETELGGSFNDILLHNDALNLSDKRKIEILNSELRPIIKSLSEIYQEYNMGFYSTELDCIIAIEPEFHSSLLQEVSGTHPYYLNSYRTGEPEYVSYGHSMGWFGNSIYSIINPIYREGDIIGHTWANFKMEDIYKSALKQLGNICLLGMALLMVVLFLTKMVIDTYNRQLFYISESLAVDNYDSQFNISSHLKPLVEKIKEEREKILKQEKELTKLERFYTIGEMAATLAHEVRNPITTIDGYIQLLNNKTGDNYIKNKLNVISKELVRVNAIISEYLLFARENVSRKSTQNLNDIIRSMYPLLQADANKHRKSIVLELTDVSNRQLDGNEIRQLIFNISRNGIEAMDDGGILKIKTYEEDGKVVLSISDEGKGIPDNILDKIAEPFFTTKDNGNGLGLSVCYRIVETHNGVIDIESSERGTTFYISFRKQIYSGG